MSIVKSANLALRFLLELCVLAALAYWGFKVGRGPIAKIGLGVGAPLLTAVVWGTFVAPGAPVPLPAPLRLILELVIFGLAAVALYAAGRPGLDVGVGLPDQPRPDVRVGAMTLIRGPRTPRR